MDCDGRGLDWRNEDDYWSAEAWKLEERTDDESPF